MKSAMEMMREVHEVESRKQREKSRYKEEMENARKCILTLTLWEKYILLPRFKRQLENECDPMLHGGQYYVHPFLCGLHYKDWNERWIRYGAFLLEESGYLNVEAVYDAVSDHFYIRATLPKTVAQQVLFGKSNR